MRRAAALRMPRASTAGRPRLAVRVLLWLAGLAMLAPAEAWLLGQVCRDQWAWSQYLFWIPACGAAVCAAAAFAFLAAVGTRLARGAAAVSAVLAALAVCATLWWDVGWGVLAASAEPQTTAGAAPPPALAAQTEKVVLLHWNGRAPGATAGQRGKALVSVPADIYVITNPGAMNRVAPEDEWKPPGYVMMQRGTVAILSRWPVINIRLLGAVNMAPRQDAAIHLAEVALPQGPLRILVVDLPSPVELPRAAVAQVVRQILAAHPDLPPVHALVGDVNSLHRSVIFDALPSTLQAAPPWRCVGWQGTFPASLPLWRIDAMRAAPPWELVRNQSVDVGAPGHLAQLGVLQHQPSGR